MDMVVPLHPSSRSSDSDDGFETLQFIVRLGRIHCQIIANSASFMSQSIEETEFVISVVLDWNLTTINLRIWTKCVSIGFIRC